MQSPVIALVVLVASLAINAQAGELLTFYIPGLGTFQFDVESMVNDPAIVRKEIQCLMEGTRCSYPVSNIIKYELKRCLFYECEGCNEVEKKAFNIIRPIIETKYAKELAQVRAKFAHLKDH